MPSNSELDIPLTLHLIQVEIVRSPRNLRKNAVDFLMHRVFLRVIECFPVDADVGAGDVFVFGSGENEGFVEDEGLNFAR